MTADPPAHLLVFADDWGRHPSSCQHLVRRLPGTDRVTWVDTIGTRPPRLDRATIRRGLQKLKDWGGPANKASDGTIRPGEPRVVRPKMWPWFRSGFDRALNRRLLDRQLSPTLRALTSPAVAVSTIPIVADLVGTLPVSRWVYYCVDDFGAWPGLDGGPLRRMEAKFVERADVLIAASEVLRDRLERMGRRAEVLTHGVDLDHWSAPPPTTGPDPLDGLERPVLLFFGVVDRRMDPEILKHLGRDLDSGTILLVGPESDPDPAISRIPRVLRRPAVPYEGLPALAASADVLIMPYDDLPVTRAMQPLKLKEYLASGRPAVARDLPANREWADCLDLAATPEAFSAAVRLRIETGLPTGQRADRGRLVSESWAEKASRFERLLLGDPSLVLEPKDAPR